MTYDPDTLPWLKRKGEELLSIKRVNHLDPI
jgi:hypothetical protein